MSLNALSPKGQEGVSTEMSYVQIKYIADVEARAILLLKCINRGGGRANTKHGVSETP